MSTNTTTMTTTKGMRNNNRKRFSDDQIKSLETMFEAESRPELRMKQHLANKLGLQPRQVAIWFQNKRARSKYKLIEQEYSVLKGKYDKLGAQYESLRKENEALVMQLEKLKKMVGEEENENKQSTLETLEEPSFLEEINSEELGMPLYEEYNGKVDYLEEEQDALDMANIAAGSLNSTETRYSYESSGLLDNCSCNSQWWDFES